MIKHTPGPWSWCSCGKCGYVAARNKGLDVAYVVADLPPPEGGPGDPEHAYWCSPRYPAEIRNANAHLIAAAPTLYEALNNLENDDNSIPSNAWELVQYALKKARGEA